MSASPAQRSDAPFDFRRPPAGPAQRRVADWLAAVCKAAPKSWAAHLENTELRLASVGQSLPADLLRPLPDGSVGVVLESPHAGAPRYLIAPRPALLALLAGLLGQPPATLPDDRDFTPVESALLGYLLEILLQPFHTPPTGTEPLPLTAGTSGPARAICPLPPTDPVILASLQFVLPCGPQPLSLLFPATRSATAAAPVAVAAERFDRAQVEAALAGAALGFSVALGQTRLTVRQLTGLKVGDVVVLDQRVAEPLCAQVAGADKFEVWPGALGRIQAVQIHRVRSPKGP